MNMHARIDALHDPRPLIAHVVFRFAALEASLPAWLRRRASPARAGASG
jgi:hypothetical protein